MNIKIGDKFYYIICDFEGKSMDEVIVKEVHEDHFLCSYTDAKMSGVTLWFEEEDINVRIYSSKEKASAALYNN